MYESDWQPGFGDEIKKAVRTLASVPLVSHPELKLRAAGSSAAVSTLITGSVARHNRPALGTHRSIRHRRLKRQRLLRIWFRRLQHRSIARLPDSILRSEELSSEPPENVVHYRLRIRHLRVAGPATRLEPHMAEFVHKELQRYAILQRVAYCGGEAIHQTRNGRAFLRHRDEDLSRSAVVEQAYRNVAFMAADGKLVCDGLPFIR